jgi:hypothetical protein
MILCDLERHQVSDLLADRQADALAAGSSRPQKWKLVAGIELARRLTAPDGGRPMLPKWPTASSGS